MTAEALDIISPTEKALMSCSIKLFITNLQRLNPQIHFYHFAVA